MPSFDLITCGWIHCVREDGEVQHELGLLDTLQRAPKMREISEASPLIEIALHRLLLAILHRVFGPADSRAWKELWLQDSFDSHSLEAYFDSWRDRFDLFDSTRPFYQVAALDFSHERPVTTLVSELSPSNDALFSHVLESACLSLSPAESARSVVAWHSFAPGGLLTGETGPDSADGAPLTRGAVVLVKGKTLFQTLMLNLVRYNAATDDPFPFQGEDHPAWERDEPILPIDRSPTGYLDLLTWQSRRIKLHPPTDEVPFVRHAVVMKGYQFPDDYVSHDRESMLAFRKNAHAKKGQDPWPAVGFREDRAVWRDSIALFASVRDDDDYTPPKTVQWLATLSHEEVISKSLTLPVDLYGQAGDRAKLLFWRHERLPLPLVYLEASSSGDVLRDHLRRSLDLSEKVASALSSAVSKVAQLVLAPDSDSPSGGTPDKKAVSELVNALAPTRLYWSRVQAHFSRFLIDQAEELRLDAWGDWQSTPGPLLAWADVIRGAAHESFEVAVQGVGAGPRGLRAVTTGGLLLRYKLGVVWREGQLKEAKEEMREQRLG